MQALLYPAYGEMMVTDVPAPSAGPGEVLVRVGACGICGSELGSFATRSTRRVPPLVMGHEFAGTVEALGDGVSALRAGDRVSILAFGFLHDGQTLTHTARIVTVDGRNVLRDAREVAGGSVTSLEWNAVVARDKRQIDRDDID